MWVLYLLHDGHLVFVFDNMGLNLVGLLRAILKLNFMKVYSHFL